ncbi:MAG: hypothetical protein HN337_03355 [Deltaproteobacteria bacterium]|jgi:V/A-type H+/Na+-transporting ATPase subunit D|nr:hypothetical protein [Deltaproteobacteria bacterium]
MATVSKGQVRTYKQRTERLLRAVPTLDLRRKQLNREILVWEEELEEIKRRYEILLESVKSNPHPEVDVMVQVRNVSTKEVNIAGVMLDVVDSVEFEDINYSLFITPPSFDIFVMLKRDLLETEARLEAKQKALDALLEELEITTQRINLFEKRLIPEYQDLIRYIKGRLEDNERSSVMIAKIAQAGMLAD